MELPPRTGPSFSDTVDTPNGRAFVDYYYDPPRWRSDLGNFDFIPAPEKWEPLRKTAVLAQGATDQKHELLPAIRRNDARDCQFIVEANLLAARSSTEEISGVLESLNMAEDAAYQDALHAMFGEHDVRLDGDLLWLALHQPRLLVVEEGDGPVAGRRVLAIADDTLVGEWNENKHNDPEQNTFLMNFHAEVPSVMREPEPGQFEQFADDVAAVTLRMDDARRRDRLPEATRVSRWPKLCAAAGKVFHEEMQRARLRSTPDERELCAILFANKVVELGRERQVFFKTPDGKPCGEHPTEEELRTLARAVVAENSVQPSAPSAYLPTVETQGTENTVCHQP